MEQQDEIDLINEGMNRHAEENDEKAFDQFIEDSLLED
jgi:hypothetical protein